jgi:hypothetical protein
LVGQVSSVQVTEGDTANTYYLLPTAAWTELNATTQYQLLNLQQQTAQTSSGAVDHWWHVQLTGNPTYNNPNHGLNFGFGDFAVENMPADIQLPQRPAVVAITKEAIEKARKLLLACLSDEQRIQFEATGYFEVVAASGTRYRITRGWGGNVLTVVNGYLRDRFCIHPAHYVPEEDNMLAQKLLLEVDEPTFLRTANRSAA